MTSTTARTGEAIISPTLASRTIGRIAADGDSAGYIAVSDVRPTKCVICEKPTPTPAMDLCSTSCAEAYAQREREADVAHIEPDEPAAEEPSDSARADIGNSGEAGPHRRKSRGSSLAKTAEPISSRTMGPLADSDDNRRRSSSTSSVLALVATSGDDFRNSSPNSPSPPGKQSRRLGAKSNAGVFHTIINQMPPHRVYIEPFLGWGTIMKAKLPADRNIGIDRDGDRIQTARLELPSAELTIGDGVAFLERFEFRGGELVYCDPPYLLETRTGHQRYNFELSDHRRLLDVLSRLPCPVILSGYFSELYDETLRTWRVVTYTGQTRGGPRTEYLWLNFPEPLELHDYRYLGRNFRERERIKRKISRWSNKLTAMPPLERHALMAALRESQQRPPSPELSSLQKL